MRYNKTMTIVLIFGYLVTLMVLLIVLGVQPKTSSHSQFELRRRSGLGDEKAKILLRQREFLRDIISLQRAVASLCLVILSVISVYLFNWAAGLILSIIIALEIGAVARIGLWQKYSQQLYEKYEPLILTTIERHQVILSLIRSVSPVVGDSRVIESKEELLEMVAQSSGAISSSEKKLIANGLKFNDMKVEEIMTPRSMIESVPMNELLGPLVLDDLHKKGYSRFPVIDGDIDHVVGMLRIQDLLTIDRKAKSHRAETVMSKDVYYIRENQTLQHALAAFLKTQHHLFVVVNEFRETVGLLSLEDVIEALLGQKIIDEYDVYGDLRKAATANPQKNNLPTKTRRDV